MNSSRSCVISGDEDRATSGRRRRPLSVALHATRDVIVDLSELTFADSSLIVDLACLAQRLRAQGRTLWLAGAQPQIRRLIESVGLAPAARGAARRAGAGARPDAGCAYCRRERCRSLLVLLFIVVPIAELAILIQVGQAIGVWWTIALLIVDAVLGSLLARSQGRATWRRFNEALQRGRAAGARGDRRRARAVRRRAAADARASSPTSSALSAAAAADAGARARACWCGASPTGWSPR